jgi:hypothetical protein
MTQLQFLALLALHSNREIQDRFDCTPGPSLIFIRHDIAREKTMADIHMPALIRLNVFSIEICGVGLACTFAELDELIVLLVFFFIDNGVAGTLGKGIAGKLIGIEPIATKRKKYRLCSTKYTG